MTATSNPPWPKFRNLSLLLLINLGIKPPFSRAMYVPSVRTKLDRKVEIADKSDCANLRKFLRESAQTIGL
jgi:hypothetical protein